MKNIILADFDVDNSWGLKKGIEEETNEEWEVISIINNTFSKNFLQKIIKYIKLFTIPLSFVINRKKIDKIVTWQQFYGLNFAFFCRLFNFKKMNKLIVMTFIYKEKKGILGKIYYKYLKYILQSNYIDKIICYSNSEVKYYKDLFKLNDDKIVFCHLGVEPIKISNANFEEYNLNKYILSAGKSNRDYDFLIESLKNSEYNVKIVCRDKIQIQYSNIEQFNKIPYNEYLKLLTECYCVVIPLDDLKISSGQLVILEAMQLNKPIIITENDTVIDYIQNNVNGFIIKKDKSILLECLEKIYSNESLYKTIIVNAQKFFNEKCTIYNLGKSIGKIITKLK